MTALLAKWQMRDPLLVLLSKEAAAEKRSCAGCAHAKVIEDTFGGKVTRCLKGKPYGKKCSKYKRGEE